MGKLPAIYPALGKVSLTQVETTETIFIGDSSNDIRTSVIILPANTTPTPPIIPRIKSQNLYSPHSTSRLVLRSTSFQTLSL